MTDRLDRLEKAGFVGDSGWTAAVGYSSSGEVGSGKVARAAGAGPNAGGDRGCADQEEKEQLNALLRTLMLEFERRAGAKDT
jgi:hypothetical protein